MSAAAATCRGPDPEIRAPAERAMAGACDSHCHVFGPQAVFPYAADRAYTPPDGPVEGLQRVHAALGLERSVIVQASCHGADNTAMLDAIARSGGRYRGVAIVDGHETDADYAALHAGGVRGVRFNFVAHLGGVPDLQLFDRTVDRMAEMGWHVVLHLDAQDILTHEARLRALRVPYVIDHMGRVKAAAGLEQAPFRTLLALLDEGRAWVKICGPERISPRAPFLDAVPFMRRLAETAPERTLWGTDWPHPNISGDMPNDGQLLDLFHVAIPEDDMRRAILVENPTRLCWSD